MLLYIARHAHAGRRAEWCGDDRIRPLTPQGIAEAEAIADGLASPDPGQPIGRILSSPARRCIETVAPLADRLGLEVEVDDRLFEGADLATVSSLLDDLGSTSTAWSTHGDVVPLLLSRLTELGMTPECELRWPKASVWAVERTDSGWGRGRYTPPPGG